MLECTLLTKTDSNRQIPVTQYNFDVEILGLSYTMLAFQLNKSDHHRHRQ